MYFAHKYQIMYFTYKYQIMYFAEKYKIWDTYTKILHYILYREYNTLDINTEILNRVFWQLACLPAT